MNYQVEVCLSPYFNTDRYIECLVCDIPHPFNYDSSESEESEESINFDISSVADLPPTTNYVEPSWDFCRNDPSQTPHIVWTSD